MAAAAPPDGTAGHALAMDEPVPQSAVVPYRVRGGRVEILVITSPRRKRWIFPGYKILVVDIVKDFSFVCYDCGDRCSLSVRK